RYLDAQAQAARAMPGRDGEALGEERAAQATLAHESHEALTRQLERVTGRRVVLDPAPVAPSTGRLEVENLVIDLDREEVLQDGQPVRLTPVERSVLAMLVGNPGRVVTRAALLLE